MVDVFPIHLSDLPVSGEFFFHVVWLMSCAMPVQGVQYK